MTHMRVRRAQILTTNACGDSTLVGEDPTQHDQQADRHENTQYHSACASKIRSKVVRRLDGSGPVQVVTATITAS